MKYRIDLHFSATISKTVDIEDDSSIIDERDKFIEEYSMDEVIESLAYVGWDCLDED
jgi:hypothetical protein